MEKKVQVMLWVMLVLLVLINLFEGRYLDAGVHAVLAASGTINAKEAIEEIKKYFE